MDSLKHDAYLYHTPFQPQVVRLVLPYTGIRYLGVKGAHRPPTKEETPKQTYLAYGSSITHGSLGITQNMAYASRIAQWLGCDLINLGFAGQARLESDMARYIVGRKDWDFMSAELGINMMADSTCEAFEQRAKAFLDILSADGRPVFVTDMFTFSGDSSEKAIRFRESVRHYAEGRTYFISGLALLSDMSKIAEDRVHPSADGHIDIAARWSRFMREKLKGGV